MLNSSNLTYEYDIYTLLTQFLTVVFYVTSGEITFYIWLSVRVDLQVRPSRFVLNNESLFKIHLIALLGVIISAQPPSSVCLEES